MEHTAPSCIVPYLSGEPRPALASIPLPETRTLRVVGDPPATARLLPATAVAVEAVAAVALSHAVAAGAAVSSVSAPGQVARNSRCSSQASRL